MLPSPPNYHGQSVVMNGIQVQICQYDAYLSVYMNYWAENFITDACSPVDSINNATNTTNITLITASPAKEFFEYVFT